MKTKFSTRMLALALILTLLVPMLVFQASAEDRVVTFNLGANGSAAHADGSSATTYTETVGGYTLNITNGTKMYSGARDAQGNGGLKFGTSSAVGSCQFTVPEDVTSVVLHVAKYKTNTAKVTVNGTTYTLTKNSNDGAYDTIMVDTSTNKTVTFTTVSGGARAMLNCIDFVIAGGADSNEPYISLKGESVLQIGEPMTMTATAENVTGDIAWSSSDETVATVDGGVVTGKKLGKATITASIGEVQATHEVTVYPKENSEITVGEALEIATFAGESGAPYTYMIMGTVESIDDAYSEKYGNITVTIGDDTGSIYVYRMNGGADLLVGQTIIVCGRLQTYQNTPQVSQYSEYELVLDDSAEAIVEALNKLDVKMSLAYRYETSVETVTKPAVTSDTLNNALTGISGTTYTDWSGKTGASGAVYAGQSAGGNSSIQLRSDKSTAGIVSTTSGGKIKSITVTWNSNTADARTLDIYGKNVAYSAATELYNSATQGTKIASLTHSNGATQTVTITGDYAYIGIRSNSGAQYIDSIVIEWENESGGATESVETVYKNSSFALRFGADKALVDIEGITSYGLVVSAGDKEVYFSTDANSWTVDDAFCSVTVDLGDIINDLTKLSTKFTAKAYVEVDGVKYVSETEATYSVADMIKEYHGLGILEVTDLYDYLAANGLI